MFLQEPESTDRVLVLVVFVPGSGSGTVSRQKCVLHPPPLPPSGFSRSWILRQSPPPPEMVCTSPTADGRWTTSWSSSIGDTAPYVLPGLTDYLSFPTATFPGQPARRQLRVQREGPRGGTPTRAKSSWSLDRPEETRRRNLRTTRCSSSDKSLRPTWWRLDWR